MSTDLHDGSDEVMRQVAARRGLMSRRCETASPEKPCHNGDSNRDGDDGVSTQVVV
jgi:hypothetical protein